MQTMDLKTQVHLNNLAARIKSARETISHDAVSEGYAKEWMLVAYDILIRLHGESSETPIRVAYWQPMPRFQNERPVDFKQRLTAEFTSAVNKVAAHVDMLQSESVSSKSPLSTASERAVSSVRSKVFVVHGHDEAAKAQVARLMHQINVEFIILSEEPNKGRTIIQKFTDHAADASFALVVMSGDDEGRSKAQHDAPLKPRTRQNVIFELGYFLSALGPGRVCALTKGGPEIPSDYEGVLYEPMDERGFWRYSVVKELKAAGFNVDANNVK